MNDSLSLSLSLSFGWSNSALRKMESYWLNGKTFIGGSSPNVADLLFCCELEQLHMLHLATDGLDITSILHPFARVRQWMKDVSQALGPQYEQVHKLLRYAAKKRHEKLSGGAGAGGSRSNSSNTKARL